MVPMESAQYSPTSELKSAACRVLNGPRVPGAGFMCGTLILPLLPCPQGLVGAGGGGGGGELAVVPGPPLPPPPPQEPKNISATRPK